ncbi:MAG: NBR1-Ig-like domain-containing protein, partial [Candidatus Promineifilaceae bacterium]|nr:NBR1-Ig-like domain-containing protein [Candidatus Promineifilaceae bacterium]
RDHLEGDLPVDAMNYHPYHRYVHTDPFHNRHFGTVQAAIRRFRDSFPELPLWITEMGVASDHPISPDRYPDVALVMREVVDEIARNHTGDVPVLIWYAWSDLMRNAGITTVDGTMKPHIADAFEAMIRRARDAAAPEHFSFAPATARADSEFQRFETTLDNHNAVPAGSTFTNRWYFRNSGGTTWGDGCRLVYAPRGGATAARMLPQAEYPLADVASPLPAAPGDEVVVQLQMTAPERAGRHVQSRWELQDARGNSFGHLFAEITTIAPSPVGTGAHHANMGFIADHTVPDDTRFPAGEAFLKQWRVRNNGARKWGDSFRLVFIEGDLQMAAGVASHTVPGAAPGESIVLSVEMVAPTPPAGRNTATFKSLWRLQDDRGNFFGDTLWARIVSVRTGAATGANLGRFTDPAGWYSQRDERWEKTQLGTGAETIGGWGCLMTCYAMMLYSYGLKLTPDALNERLCGLGSAGFDGSIVQFAAPPRLVPQLKLGRNMRSWRTPELPWTVWTGEDPIQRIDTSLAKGYTVLAQVDMGPNDAYNATNEQHWVILVSRTPAGDDYLMLDPMTPPEQLHQQPLSLMRKYGNPHPNRTPQENLRHAIKSALIYYT